MSKQTKRTLWVLGLVFLLLGVGCGVWAADYYHADPEAAALLTGGQGVEVRPIDGGWLLDGPGTRDAFVFYPGGKVEATAYLPLLTALARDGVDCFLVRMPLNLAFFKTNAAGAIRAAYAYDRWYLGGHSLGGAMAAVYAAGHGDDLDGLVLLAAYATKPLPEHLAVLELHGSADGVLNREKLAAGRQYLPASAVCEELPGGNHAQFGAYGPETGDGAAGVTGAEQLAWAVDRIEQMILGN